MFSGKVDAQSTDIKVADDAVVKVEIELFG